MNLESFNHTNISDTVGNILLNAKSFFLTRQQMETQQCYKQYLPVFGRILQLHNLHTYSYTRLETLCLMKHYRLSDAWCSAASQWPPACLSHSTEVPQVSRLPSLSAGLQLIRGIGCIALCGVRFISHSQIKERRFANRFTNKDSQQLN